MTDPWKCTPVNGITNQPLHIHSPDLGGVARSRSKWGALPSSMLRSVEGGQKPPIVTPRTTYSPGSVYARGSMAAGYLVDSN